MIKKNKKNLRLKFLLLFSFIFTSLNLFFIGFAFAESCPVNTIVTGTSIIFVGELSDLGGDSSTSVWFEYGKTTNYGEKTVKKILVDSGVYCIELKNLSPLTTYQYRAVAENSAGISYGANKSFKTGQLESVVNQANFTVNKTVRNLSQNSDFSKKTYTRPGEVLVFGIVVKAGSNSVQNVILKETLPIGLIYDGELKVDDVLNSGNIFSGLNIGNIPANQTKTVTFRVKVAQPESFSFGQTEISNKVLVSSGNISLSDKADIIVVRAAISGIATEVPTGLTNNILFDSFILPLLITLIVIFLFKSKIINFERWLDLRKKEYQIYRSNKILQIKIAKIKLNNFLKK